MIRALMIFVIISTSLFAQEWFDISPFESNSVNVSGSFISSEIGWVIDKNNDQGREIYFTSNSGNDWEMIYTFSDDLDPITSIIMTDELNGWVTLDYFDHFYKTSDGGYSWSDMTSYIPEIENIDTHYFVNDLVGFIGAYDYSETVTYLYRTGDGGYTWDSIDIPTHDEFYTYYRVQCFYFLNDSVGWAGCDYDFYQGNLIYTTDSGENWIAMEDPFPWVGDVKEIKFIDNQHGLILCHGCLMPYMLLTTDNCQNYTEIYLSYIDSICLQDNSNIWGAVSPYGIYMSSDNGENFELLYSTSSFISDIQFFDNIGFFFGNNNTLLRFTDQVGITDENINLNPISDFGTFPNPFNPSLNIHFSVHLDSEISLEIFNTLGQKIRTLEDRYYSQGDYSLIWDGKDDNSIKVSSGLYIVNLISNNEVVTSTKCVLIK